jgi:hypothetical protein
MKWRKWTFIIFQRCLAKLQSENTHAASRVLVVYVALIRMASTSASAIMRCSLFVLWPSWRCQYCSSMGTEIDCGRFGSICSLPKYSNWMSFDCVEKKQEHMQSVECKIYISINMMYNCTQWHPQTKWEAPIQYTCNNDQHPKTLNYGVHNNSRYASWYTFKTAIQHVGMQQYQRSFPYTDTLQDNIIFLKTEHIPEIDMLNSFHANFFTRLKNPKIVQLNINLTFKDLQWHMCMHVENHPSKFILYISATMKWLHF